MRAFVRVVASIAAVAVSACGGEPPPAAPTPVPPAFVRVDVVLPTSAGLAVPGDTLQLRAVASFDDGSRTDVTGEAQWSAVNPAVLSVDARGLVTAMDYGFSIVSARYRNRAGEANLEVRRGAGPQFTVSGVVFDAATNAPVVGAIVDPFCRRTDGNGFFQCTVGSGAVLKVSAFGYEDGSLMLPGGTPPSSVRIPLTPNPGSYIERTADGFFEEFDYSAGLAVKDLRIVTRAGGLFDAWVDSDNCDYNGSLQLAVRSGGVSFASGGPSGACYARLRFVVPASEVLLTIKGNKTTSYHLIYREPR